MGIRVSAPPNSAAALLAEESPYQHSQCVGRTQLLKPQSPAVL